MTLAGRFTQSLFDSQDISLVGGKAASLGRLLRAGFAVPDGFVVTTRAYRAAQNAPEVESSSPTQPLAASRISEQSESPPPTPSDAPANQTLSHQAPFDLPAHAPTAHGPAPDTQLESHVSLLTHTPANNGNGTPHPHIPRTLPPEISEEIRLAYRHLGGGPVAVRSSATAEDMAGASMAGQYETFLDIVGEEALIEAVASCWASLGSERILAYLREHQIDPAAVAMAVVVQRLVPADVAGVLFTANPLAGTRREMLVEASWGLGESVVSGRVQPDVFRLERDTGRVLSATIAEKNVQLLAGAGKETAVDEAQRRRPSLGGKNVHALWQLGGRVAEHFQSPQDIEWAIHQGRLFLLQSRPITTLDEAEACEQVLRETRAHLRDRMAAGRGPYVLHNLAETLAHPTPFTWSIIGRFMTGAGGFGAMYRQVGFEPSPIASREGFLEQLGGRIYMDASRAPEMFFENFPFAYDPEELKRSPDASQSPPTLPRGSLRDRMRAMRRLSAVNANLQTLATDFDRQLHDTIFPAFAAWCAAEKRGQKPFSAAEKLSSPINPGFETTLGNADRSSAVTSHNGQLLTAFFHLFAWTRARVILRYSDGSSRYGKTRRSFGVPQDDPFANRSAEKRGQKPFSGVELSTVPSDSPARATENRDADSLRASISHDEKTLVPPFPAAPSSAGVEANSSSAEADEKRLLTPFPVAEALAALSDAELIELWHVREKKILQEFAPQSLLPSLISGMALAELRAFLDENFWDEDPDELSLLISSGAPANRTVVADAELYEVGKGSRSMEAWLADHGHRAAGEFDLAVPRWRERPDSAVEMAARLAAGDSPLARHDRHRESVEQKVAELRHRLAAVDATRFDQLVSVVRRYVTFREDAKDFLMLGYDLLRDVALEMGRRLDIGQDIFYLTLEDAIDAFRFGIAPLHVIESRKRRYRAEGKITLAHVIDAAAIDSLGDVPEVKSAGGYSAFAVSSGQAAGPARILRSPTEAGDIGKGYILVCPSTDPSWTPLFVNAAGLVLECGGTLSHGAVVAREMGLPAVVLPDATRLFQNGESISVDGRRGLVTRSSDVSSDNAAPPIDAAVDADDVRVPRALTPPPPGRTERSSATLRNIVGALWLVYLAAAFLLDDRWVYQPSLAVLDRLLWPILRATGRSGVVAIIAAGLAVLTLLIQKFMTDNPRLLEAKHRAALLKKAADVLPKGSRRRAAFARLADPAQWRTLMAAMLPVALLLGPMVMTFVWLTERVPPEAWNAPAGSTVSAVATIDSSWTGPITLRLPNDLSLDESTPASRTLPPIRATLERLLRLYRQPYNDPAQPWELKTAPDLAREQTAASLEAYLAAGIPPRKLTWMIRTPAGVGIRENVSVATEPGSALSANLVVGDQYPPSPATITGPKSSPIRELKLEYAKEKPVLAKPLAFVGGWHIPLISRWADMEVGWLWIYVLAYLSTLLLLRAVLKIA